MAHADLAITIAAILLTPGPVKSVLAIVGAERGIKRGLIPATVATAVASVALMLLLLMPFENWQDLSLLRDLLHMLSIIWLIYLAWHILDARKSAPKFLISGRQLVIAMLLNPKLITFVMVVLPQRESAPIMAAMLAVALPLNGLLWLFIGSALPAPNDSADSKHSFHWLAAIWLVLMALWLLFFGTFDPSNF